MQKEILFEKFLDSKTIYKFPQNAHSRIWADPAPLDPGQRCPWRRYRYRVVTVMTVAVVFLNNHRDAARQQSFS